MNLIKNLFFSIFLLFSLTLSSWAADHTRCSIEKGFALDTLVKEIGSESTVDKILERKVPSVVAHGKNKNVAEESTWPNFTHAVKSGDGWLTTLEVDAMITRDGQFVIMHDPTFHRLVKDYHTPDEMVARFKMENPDLAKLKEGQWDFNLFDEASLYDMKEIKDRFRFFDESSGFEFEPITLKELISAVKVEGEFHVPAYAANPRAPPKNPGTVEQTYGLSPEVVKTKTPISLYVDFKPINNYTRRLYGLSDWHWIRTSWNDAQIRGFTRGAISHLSQELSSAKAHDKVFIAVRHPEIAKMTKEVDPKIITMASPDNVTKSFTTKQLIESMEEFMPYKPKLVEVKYLEHILDPEFRAWAKEKKVKIFFNQIEQVDTRQFEGIYQNNVEKLLDDLTAPGSDIMLQTNTVETLTKSFSKRFQQ